MSGYVALNRKVLNIPDVYDLPAHSPYGFDRSFDAKIGYRTKSMLCAPLLSRVGVIRPFWSAWMLTFSPPLFE